MKLTEIEAKYFDLIDKNISLKEFENWVYKSDFLEKELGYELYIKLISLNYENNICNHDIEEMLKEKVDYGKYQINKIIKLLDSVIEKNGLESNSFKVFYELYCDGYYFFEDLGLGIGLFLNIFANRLGAESFDELDELKKENVVNSSYPKAKELAIELKDWFIQEKIILRHNKNVDEKKFDFIDLRDKKDCESRLWEIVKKDPKTNEIKSKKNIFLDEKEFFKGK